MSILNLEEARKRRDEIEETVVDMDQDLRDEEMVDSFLNGQSIMDLSQDYGAEKVENAIRCSMVGMALNSFDVDKKIKALDAIAELSTAATDDSVYELEISIDSID